MSSRGADGGRWRHLVGVADRGPGESYRPDDRPPSIFGAHQPGIATPQLDYVAFAALDVTLARLAELRELLCVWSAEAEGLMSSRHAQAAGAGLTVTFGLGPGIFAADGEDRFGLLGARPAGLRELPAFPGDALTPDICGGDVCVAVCAREAAVARDALDRLALVARGAAVVRWVQPGSLLRGPADRPPGAADRPGGAAPGRPGGTPRDLLGFKDGTSNPRRGKDLDRHVWVRSPERSWMLGGTFLVVRRISLLLDAWRGLSLNEQEHVIGRRRDSGAPLGRRHEFDRLPLADTDAAGEPVIAPDAHVRLAARESNGGVAMLRRSYSYDNGAGTGIPERDAGLLLLAYQRDPRRQYVPLQRRLAERDALSAFTRHVGSGVFAIPPGARPRGFIAESLLAGA